MPGWFFLRVRRHAELLTGLDDAELSALGHRARDLVAAVAEATGAPATYLLHFGENYRHFHALVAARGADIPAAQRGGNILGLRPGHLDRDAAVALVPGVRAAYERIACGAPDRGRPLTSTPVCSGVVSLPGDLLGEEGALGLVRGQVERLPVGGGRLAGPAEPASRSALTAGRYW